MTSLRPLQISSFLFTLTLALSGCYLNELTNSVGNYNGVLTEKSGATTTQSRISAQLTLPSQYEILVQVQAVDTNRTWTFGITSGRRSVTLTSQEANLNTQLRAADQSCYVNADAPNNSTASTRVCYDGRTASLDISARGAQPAMSFSADRMNPGEVPVMETPGTYPVSKLVERTMNQAFNSKVEFEHVVQARLTSQNARLNLLPHFNVNTLLGFFSISATTLIRSVGDLAPFLLPTRWYRAGEAKFKSEAEYDAWILMKADSGNISEGLAYAISRDTQSIKRMENHRAAISEVRDEIYARERLGLVPPGTTDDFDAVLNTVDKGLLLFRETMQEEYTALAQTSGFFNPNAIQNVLLDTPASVEHPLVFNPAQMAQQALERSYELKQADALIGSARLSRKESFFDWLDPAGDSNGYIGFGMGAYLAIGASHVRELQNQRQQLQSLILKKVADTTNDLNNSVTSFSLSQRSVSIQGQRVQRMLDNLRVGVVISFTDLANALSDETQADLSQVDAQFSYLVAYSKINRVLLTGPYANVVAQASPTRP